MRLRSWCLVSVSVVAGLAEVVLARSQPVVLGGSQLVVFGDSLSDDGHGSWRLSNGSWPADPAYAGGRFANGRVWAEHAAESLGLSLRDYAVGGATSDNRLVRGGTGKGLSITSPSLLDQVDSHRVQPGAIHCILSA